jgi:hypothetical protein
VRRTPTPLPCFLEVLILNNFKSLFPELLIPGDFKSFAPEVLILVGLKSLGMNVIENSAKFLEVLILVGLGFRFSEVLILEDLEPGKRRFAMMCSAYMNEHSTNYTSMSM